MEAPRQGSSNPTDTPYLEAGDGSTPSELSATGWWDVLWYLYHRDVA